MSALSIALISGALALARAYPQGVPQIEVVRERNDRWVLAYALGEMDGLRDVYAAASGGTRAHYYSVVAHRGQRVRIELRRSAGSGAASRTLQMVLTGPDLPRGPYRIAEARPADGLLLSHPAGAAEVLEVKLPVRGSYVLVVRILDGRPCAYRLRFAGEGHRSPGVLIRMPLRLFEAAYLVSPRRAALWVLALLGACGALHGLRRLAGRRVTARQGGFTG